MMPVPTVYRSALDQAAETNTSSTASSPALFNPPKKFNARDMKANIDIFRPKKFILESIRPTDRP